MSLKFVPRKQEFFFSFSDDYEAVTMDKATKLFLDKIDTLFGLSSEIKEYDNTLESELDKIEVDLEKLRSLVEEDKCLNAGGKFEWVDSILVKVGLFLLFKKIS